MTITYRKGPLGYAVSMNGKSVGVLKKVRRGGYIVTVVGFRPSRATHGQHHTNTLSQAKALAEKKLVA